MAAALRSPRARAQAGSAKAGALLQQLPSAPVYKFTIVSLPRVCLLKTPYDDVQYTKQM